ncbi:MAG: ABC transporter ATP-binding protein [Gemmatimonadaceae bacterium]
MAFGVTQALDGASLTVSRGTVHALLGENGAGKTTLMRVAFGLLRPDTGRLRVHGRTVRFASPADAIAAGIGMVHQHFTLVPAMTVAENVALGGHGHFNIDQTRARIRQIGTTTGLNLDPDAPVSALPISAQQRLEIIKALARDASVLILDEPTAVLAPHEATELLAWLRRYAATGGTAIVITHKLREAISVADEVTVLRRGRTVLLTPAAEATEERLAEAMVGGAPPALSDDAGKETVLEAAVVVRAARLDVADEAGTIRVRGATLELRGGELLGIAAIEGAGQRELLRTLAGRLPPAAGTLEIPSDVGFVPEDRQQAAVILDFTLTENAALRGAGARRGLTGWKRTALRTTAFLERFDVRATSPDAYMRALSGGNQQKFVLARELDGEPPLLVVENPSRGLDIRATAAVHERLRHARAAGAAVIVYSSDLDEVLSLATRVAVVFAGVVREVRPAREAVARAMLGATDS